MFASVDGKPRPLSPPERVRLYERILELKPDDPIAIAYLATAELDLAIEAAKVQ